MIKKKNRGFTLVEVLICVGIIGIIAAITIPALLSSTSEKALETQRKALHSRTAQVFAQIKNLKAYESNTNYSALQLVNTGLMKIYKIISVCDKNSLEQCGIPNTIHDYYNDTGSYSYSLYGKDNFTLYNPGIPSADLGNFLVDIAGFKTANGESILLYYNPRCKSKSEAEHNLIYSVCVNMIYDLNGRSKAPNAYGEDIGYITVFYPTDSSVVMPILHHEESAAFTSGSYQDMLNKSSEKELVPPTAEELISILINKNLTKITSEINEDELFWSSSYTTNDTSKAWAAGINEGLKKQVTSGASAASHPYFLLKK